MGTENLVREFVERDVDLAAALKRSRSILTSPPFMLTASLPLPRNLLALVGPALRDDHACERAAAALTWLVSPKRIVASVV